MQVTITLSELRATIEEVYGLGRADERRRIQKLLDEHIVTGHLPGDGRDKTAERNGLIIAYNLVTRPEQQTSEESSYPQGYPQDNGTEPDQTRSI